jgi:hypothetical protein
VPPLTSDVLVFLMAAGTKLETLFSIGPKAAMVPTDCCCSAIQGVRSVASIAVPGARTAIADAIASIFGAGTMVPGTEVALPSAQILHFVREFVKEPLKLSIVRWRCNARERRTGDGFNDAVCA